MTRTHRIALIPVLVVAVAATGLVVASSSSATTATPAAAPAVFTRTVAGTDMHSLDARVTPQLVPNTGGGVSPSYESNAVPQGSSVTFEAGIDLPKGAKVTAISFTVTPGDRTGCLGEALRFGSYVPNLAITTTNISFTTPGHNAPCLRGTFTKTGNPIATVVNGRRYMIQWQAIPTADYPGDARSTGIFHGATVQYTCTSPCVP